LEVPLAAVGGDDGGKLREGAVVDHLEEALLGPGRAFLHPEVVEHQQVDFADILEEVIAAQIVEEVGDAGKEDVAAIAEGAVGDAGREVGLAAAVGPLHHEPALGVLRVGHGDPQGGLERRALVLGQVGTPGIEVLELHPTKAFEGHTADGGV
jgi:hypothetical protein